MYSRFANRVQATVIYLIHNQCSASQSATLKALKVDPYCALSDAVGTCIRSAVPTIATTK